MGRGNGQHLIEAAGGLLAHISSGSVQTVHSAFFEPAGTDAFVATPATAGPWSAQAQHGGPPSALAARALEPGRAPAAQFWLLLDAVTTIGEKGTGLAETTLSDVHARCGTALQTLLVAPR